MGNPLSTDQALARAVQRHMHPSDLAGGEHEHGIVVNVVHVVHEQVAVGPVVAGHMGKRRLAEIWGFCVGSIIDKVPARAIGGIAPDVAEIQEMTDFMGSGAAQVEGSRSTAAGTKGGVENHNAIGIGGTPRELSIAE